MLHTDGAFCPYLLCAYFCAYPAYGFRANNNNDNNNNDNRENM